MTTQKGALLLEIMTTRFGVYQLLARLWAEEVDEALWQGLSSADFPTLSGAPELDLAWKNLGDYIHTAKPDVLRELAADYSMLCRGVNPVKGADPYESVHRNPLRLMMQDEWEEVLMFYSELGFQLSESAVEPEDHLGIELECMAHLCKVSLQAYEKGDERAFQSSVNNQIKMLDLHLLQWVPHFVGEVLKVAETEFYTSVAVVTREYLAMDAEVLKAIERG